MAEKLENRRGVERLLKKGYQFDYGNRKKIEAPMTYFKINEQIINKYITNLKLSKCPRPDEISKTFLNVSLNIQPNI